MTDNELKKWNKDAEDRIINALECCTTNGASCKGCPAFVKVDRSNCKKYFRGALDLINRQKEEIERLESELKTAGATVLNLHSAMENIKAEAIKEFAENVITEARLRLVVAYALSEESKAYTEGVIDARQRLIDVIDNLVKEMVGDQPPLNDVKCKDCEYLELELPYAVCSKAYKGIVQPNDSCGKGKLKEMVGDV